MVAASNPAPSNLLAASSLSMPAVAAIATTRANFSIGSTTSLLGFFAIPASLFQPSFKHGKGAGRTAGDIGGDNLWQPHDDQKVHLLRHCVEFSGLLLFRMLQTQI